MSRVALVCVCLLAAVSPALAQPSSLADLIRAGNRKAALDSIRTIGEPDSRDAEGRVPPLMPCWECRHEGRGPFHSHGPSREAMFGPSPIELLDARSWCFCCHRCGSVFQNKGEEGLTEALLVDDSD